MAANETSLKKLRESAEAALAAGVANKAQLIEAVPALVELQKRIKSLQANVTASAKVAEALSKLCSDYAHGHPQFVFDQTFSVSPIGVESGDLTIDGATYHFSYGFDGYMRADPGQKLTQDFLAGLPDGWAKPKLEIDATAIKNATATDDDALAANGLMRKTKCKWSEL